MPVLQFLAALVWALLDIVSICMLLRAVLSWFIRNPDSTIHLFLRVVTEPFIIPVRTLLDKMNIGVNSPIDIAFFVTYMLIQLLLALL